MIICNRHHTTDCGLAHLAVWRSSCRGDPSSIRCPDVYLYRDVHTSLNPIIQHPRP